MLPNIFTAIHAEIMDNIPRKVNINAAYYAALMTAIRRICLDRRSDKLRGIIHSQRKGG